jgi:hypothetical protein
MSNRRARRPMRIVDGVPVIRTEPDDPDTISALAVPTAYRRPATVEELLWLVAAGYEVTGRVEAEVTVDGGLRWRNLHKTGGPAVCGCGVCADQLPATGQATSSAVPLRPTRDDRVSARRSAASPRAPPVRRWQTRSASGRPRWPPFGCPPPRSPPCARRRPTCTGSPATMPPTIRPPPAPPWSPCSWKPVVALTSSIIDGTAVLLAVTRSDSAVDSEHIRSGHTVAVVVGRTKAVQAATQRIYSASNNFNAEHGSGHDCGIDVIDAGCGALRVVGEHLDFCGVCDRAAAGIGPR